MGILLIDEYARQAEDIYVAPDGAGVDQALDRSVTAQRSFSQRNKGQC